ncbi:MAG: peroxide stress protein YaaA [Saprospiraceae bacterium]|nr:peroxide stress protein YaaA [Bacteroidia bacterium]MBT8230298.1 peroxide stress protein YaaA [Bacteroidia bacterium]NNF20516.1 peroxide stress protein YaaA [Saprospiraceae bacterium]NNK90109.1 peroxide stress protein YaaA [Saprospiraceae bacterium]
MISVLSPSKRLNYNDDQVKFRDTPMYSSKAKQLIGILKKKSKPEIMALMNINEKLADLNVDRYKSFKKDYTEDNSKAALLAFTGDVYLGLDAKSLTTNELEFAQGHLRILSGLYGLLKPLDAMQPYRLEMGSRLENRKGKNLYEFWGLDITKEINKLLATQNDPVLVNLASKEYFSVLDRKKIKGDIIDIHFKEFRNGQLKFLSFNAKKARGFMARYIIKNKIEDREGLKGFNLENYYFEESLSDSHNFTFVR